MDLYHDSKSPVDSGNKILANELVNWETEIPTEEQTKHRAVATRVMYLAQNRLNIAYVAKEASRGMLNSALDNHNKFKHLCRSLISKE